MAHKKKAHSKHKHHESKMAVKEPMAHDGGHKHSSHHGKHKDKKHHKD